MEDLNRFEQLLKQRSFKNLDEEEKNFVFQFIRSEEEYESLRNAEVELKTFFERKPELVPRKETLLKIKQSRAQMTTSPQSFWLRPAVPAYTMVLLMLGVGVLGWWSGTRIGSEKVLVEKIVPRVDTIRIESKPDTIVKEKIIYLPSQPVTIVSHQPEKNETVTAKGVNMKDKEELERLLVSGSY